ncbi:MAG: iron-containing alcohol dehydrogenase [Ilumatobacter sp.]|nr:MAG: iron-containing alcohol dehydrogenase [Ilumatobacter sp.]
MTLPASWNYPTAIWSGAGRVADLPDACRLAGIRSPLVVTDAGLAPTELVRGLVDLLRTAGLRVGLFGDARADPTTADVERGIVAFGRGGHDGVVAVGGGSALDVGKLVAFAAGQALPLLDYVDEGDNWRAADPGAMAPVIAVPTTAGTGSEVGRAGVVLDESTHTKRIVFHPAMVPAVVVCDPELTIGLPASLTVGTGMDALAHCLEAYCVPTEHPMADGIAMEGMRLVFEHLPVALSRPDDLEARQQMLWAAVMGGTAFQKGLGAMHALAHPIGAHHRTHHGMTNAVLMPYVLAANLRAIGPRLDRLARWLDLGTAADDVLRAVVDLRSSLGVPDTLAALGVPADSSDTIAAAAPLDPSAAGNPVRLTTELAGRIFDAAHSGRLD